MVILIYSISFSCIACIVFFFSKWRLKISQVAINPPTYPQSLADYLFPPKGGTPDFFFFFWPNYLTGFSLDYLDSVRHFPFWFGGAGKNSRRGVVTNPLVKRGLTCLRKKMQGKPLIIQGTMLLSQLNFILHDQRSSPFALMCCKLVTARSLFAVLYHYKNFVKIKALKIFACIQQGFQIKDNGATTNAT